MKRLMLYTAVVLTTLMVLVILWEFRIVLLLFLLALSLASTIRPAVVRLVRRDISGATAALLLYAGGIAGLLLALLLLSDLLLLEFNVAVNLAVIRYDELVLSWREGADWQQFALGNLLPAGATRDSGQVLPAILDVTFGVGSAAAGLAVILAMSIYWSVDQSRFERLWLSVLPVSRRIYARNTWREIESDIGRYLRNQMAQSVLIAILLWLGGYLARVDFPLILALFGALAAFVPYLGGPATMLVAFVIGGLESPATGVGLALYTLLLFWALDRLVKPRLWPRERRSFLLTLLVMIPLVESFGVWGLVAAPPLALALEALVRQLYGAAVTGKKPEVQYAQLAARHQELTTRLESIEPTRLPPELRNLAQRLAALLDAANSEPGR